MDGKLENAKQWTCPNDHVLGMVERVRISNVWVTRLVLFRNAINFESGVLLDSIDVIGNIDDGTVIDVRCSCCGAVRTWWKDKRALNVLEALYGKEKV